MTVFLVTFFVYQNDTPTATAKDTPPVEAVRKARVGKSRINRETYVIPEPCQGCPGENGQGVQLTVSEGSGDEGAIACSRRRNRKIWTR